MSYGLILGTNRTSGDCDGPENLQEAIEFAMRTNTSSVYGPWIPLRLTRRWPDEATSLLFGTSIFSDRIRGYDVEGHGVPVSSIAVAQQVTICGEDLLPANASEVQFRWMNTVSEPGKSDMWAIFNVTADLITSNNDVVRIFGTNNSE